MEDLPLVTTPAPVAEPQTIAPWWHTIAVLLLLAIWGGISSTRTRTYTNTPHAVTYLSQMAMSWMLFGTVVAGILHRGAFFYATLKNRARSFSTDARSGLAIYLGVLLSGVVIAIFVAAGTSAYRAHQSTSPQASTNAANDEPSQQAAPLPPPAPSSPPTSPLRFNSKTVLALAPRTPFDLLIWIGLSCTAGFCEEHIFRGYLLTQAIAFSRRAGLPLRFAGILSIAVVSLIFGSLHLYEGTAGALLITVLGAVYSVIALRLGNLRAVIAAHFLQDFCSGLFLFLFHTRLAH
jgi:membrane protease YdiL (CAAX protease family)